MLNLNNFPQPESDRPDLHMAAMGMAEHPFSEGGYPRFTALAVIPEQTGEDPNNTEYRTAAVLGGVVRKGLPGDEFRGFLAILLEESTAKYGRAFHLQLYAGDTCRYEAEIDVAEGRYATAEQQSDGSTELSAVQGMRNDDFVLFGGILQRVRFSRDATERALHRLDLSEILGDEAAEAAVERERQQRRVRNLFSRWAYDVAAIHGVVLSRPEDNPASE